MSDEDRQKAESLFDNVNKIKEAIKDYKPALWTVGGIDVVVEQLNKQLEMAQKEIDQLERSRFSPPSQTTQQQMGGGQSTSVTTSSVTQDQEVSKAYVQKLNEQTELRKTKTQLENLKSVYADTTSKDLLEAYTAFQDADKNLKKVLIRLTKISNDEKH